MNLVPKTLISTTFAALCATAFAQSTIDHNKALAGNVTPGDSSGYPVVISAPGSYKLTGNLVVPPGTDGIVITADGVTLDLNGYSISGPQVCTGDTAYTVYCQGGVTALGVRSNKLMTTVRNGLVQGFAGGIGLGTDGTRGSYRVEDIVAVHNTVFGVYLMGGTVARTQGNWNGVVGILVQEGAMVESAAVHNKHYGFSGRRVLVNGSHTHGSPFAFYMYDKTVTFVSSYIEGDKLAAGGSPISLGNNYCNGAAC